MIERLKLFARIEDGGGSCDLQFQTSPSREAAAMLRDVAAERDALAERIDGLTEDALRFKRLWNTERASLRKRSDEVCGLEYRLGEAEAKADRLAAMVEKLREYVVHDKTCNPQGSRGCTCGLSDLLQQSQPLDQQPTPPPTDVKP